MESAPRGALGVLAQVPPVLRAGVDSVAAGSVCGVRWLYACAGPWDRADWCLRARYSA